MRKIVYYLLVLTALLLTSSLLAGCNGLTQYTLTEQQINQALQQRIHFSKNIGLTGFADASVNLGVLQSQIGREEPGKITLTGEVKVLLTSLFGDQQATLYLSLKTQPVFDKQQGAIYLHELQLTQSQAVPEKLNGALSTLSPFLNQALRNYFNENPVYVLDGKRSKAEAMAKKYAKGIEVKAGEIVIPFAL